MVYTPKKWIGEKRRSDIKKNSCCTGTIHFFCKKRYRLSVYGRHETSLLFRRNRWANLVNFHADNLIAGTQPPRHPASPRLKYHPPRKGIVTFTNNVIIECDRHWSRIFKHPSYLILFRFLIDSYFPPLKTNTGRGHFLCGSSFGKHWMKTHNRHANYSKEWKCYRQRPWKHLFIRIRNGGNDYKPIFSLTTYNGRCFTSS